MKPEQEALLNATFIGAFSTIRHNDGFVSTNPVSYRWDGTEIEISTLKSRMKYKNLVANPTATLCVLSPENHMHYVELRGTVRMVDDPDRELFRDAFTQLAGMAPPADMDPPGSERVSLYLKPEQVSSPIMYAGQFDEMGANKGD